MTGVLELLSLLAALAVCLIVVPALVTNYGIDDKWYWRTAAGFQLTSAFLMVSTMLTGILRAGYPGILAALWFFWIAGLLIWSDNWGLADIRPRLQRAFLELLKHLESRPEQFDIPIPRLSRTGLLLCLLAIATLIHRSWFALHNLRFSRMETYSRVLELQRFSHREIVYCDATGYLLRPLGVFSGLYPDALVRFAGPLFSVLLVLAVALCAVRYLRSSEAALAASALVAIWPILAGVKNPGEISGAEMAATFWLLALVFAGRSWFLAACACFTALFLSFKLSIVLLVAGASMLLVYGFFHLLAGAPRFRAWVPGAVAGFAALLLLVDSGSPVDDGPFEYEAAARVCQSIAAQFPRNQWLIVSPAQELAFTYGRGWHYELVDFVSGNTVEQVSSKQYSFPYEVKDIFIFVEKQPLDGMSFDLTGTMDRAVLAYHTSQGRSSLEFRAGTLLAAYQANHQNISKYYEDQHLLVFHVAKGDSHA